MIKRGENTKYPREVINKAVDIYMTTTKSAKEVSEEFDIPAPVIRYHAKKQKGKIE